MGKVKRLNMHLNLNLMMNPKLNSNLNFGMATYRDLKLSGKDNRGLFILFMKSNLIW